MSKYTTELRFVCEEYAGLDESVGYNNVEQVIDESRSKIFDFNYPIFDTNYKPTLETKIIQHYYTREISEETVGLWKLRLKAKMNEIMPYYNKLYESELLEYNPLYTHDIKIEGESHGLNERDLVENSSQTGTLSGSDATVLSGADTNRLGGTDTTVRDNNETLALGGSDITTQGGSDSKSKQGSGSITNSGNDTMRMSGSDVSSLGGSDVERQSGSDVVNNDERHDEWNLFSDTPQGGIYGIQDAESFGPDDVSPDPSVSGNGYLTDARHVFGNTYGSENTTNYGKTETTQYGKTDTTQYGKTETMTHGKVENRQDAESESVTYGKTDTVRYGKSSEKEIDETTTQNYGKTETVQYGKNETVNYGKVDTRIGNSRNAGTITDTGDYLEHIYGWRGYSPNKSVLEYRDTFLNIDMMIIDELKDLFFMLW